jgi:hypothetical protein
MRRGVRHGLAIATTAALFCAFAPAAPAQDLGDVLGTTILNGILTGIALPQVPVPDPTVQGGDPTQQQPAQTQPQTQATPAPVTHGPSYYCKAESKRHVRGFSGTPFRRCVQGLTRLQNGQVSTPAKACASLSRKRFPGMKRTPYAACVAGGRQLLADRG